MSDLARPLAIQMDYLATIRDGSTGKLVNGYWLVEMYASVRRKNPLPILPEPFSHEHPQCLGQNPVVIDVVRRVLTLTGIRGILVVDRGGDARVFLDDWLDNAYRFVVRMRGDRDLTRYYTEIARDGQWIVMETRRLADHTPTPHRCCWTVKSKSHVVLRISQIGWVKYV